MHDSVVAGDVVEIMVHPSVPSHHVWIFYQVEELGPRLRDVVALIQHRGRQQPVHMAAGAGHAAAASR